MDLALFDFDGTISTGDTWTPFMKLAVGRTRLIAGRVLLAPVVVGYRAGMVSASRGRQIAARFGFRGQRTETIRRLGRDYASASLPSCIRPSALERIAWHRSRGDRVVVVSGSLDVYLHPWCSSQGLECICATLEERDGRLTGRYVRGDCSGQEKARRIRERYDLSRYDVVFAYGDSGEDREMLDLAQRKFYRWVEISRWNDVTSYGHPRPFSGPAAEGRHPTPKARADTGSAVNRKGVEKSTPC